MMLGKISDCRVYHRVLTQREIALIYYYERVNFWKWYKRLWFWATETWRVLRGKKK